MKLLLIFVGLTICNVVLSTIKSIATVKASKGVASFINAGYYAYYNIVLLFTVADFPMWQKCLVTFICNLIGVFCVKWAEEKLSRDKMWKIEMTIPGNRTEDLHEVLENRGIPHNYIPNLGKWTVFNLYCATAKESAFAKELVEQYGAKYFVSETKIL